MRESEEREYERLKTVDDYFAEFEKLENASGTIPPDRLDQICNILSKALCQKYKYVIKFSAPYRRKQGMFSRFSDWLEERREFREYRREQREQRDKESENIKDDKSSDARLGSPPFPALASSQQDVEILSTVPVKELAEGKQKSQEENPQEEN